MNCLKCENENLNDYPVCDVCAKTAHFTNRPCRCASCLPLAPIAEAVPVAAASGSDRPLILIAKGEHGTFDVQLPFRHYAFLSEFKLKVGRSFRTWNEFRGCWQIKPLDAGHLELVAQIIRRHFKQYDIAIAE